MRITARRGACGQKMHRRLEKIYTTLDISAEVP
jgi:hypothetical protein